MSARGAVLRLAPPLADANARRAESDRVHAWLRDAILEVTLKPGDALAESEVAQRFGLSRTPVREALLRLAGEGLVEIRPQRGTYVARLSLARVEEALFVRTAIECAVLQRVAAHANHRATADALMLPVDAQERAIAAHDVVAAIAADARFHRTLVEASGLPGVWTIVAQARDLDHRIRAIAVPELGSARDAIADHRAIVRAVRAGNAVLAQRRMTAHLARNVALARAIARRHPGYFVEGAGTVPGASPASRTSVP